MSSTSACEADALAHAAGELVRVALLEAGEADLVDVVSGDVVALALRRAAQLKPEGDVADHGRPRHQGEILEHEGALRSGPGDAPAVDENLAGGRLDEAGDDLEQGGLAATARSEQRGQRPPREVEVDVAQSLGAGVVDLVDAAHFDDGARRVRGDGAARERRRG
jgi:hypothetical protein